MGNYHNRFLRPPPFNQALINCLKEGVFAANGCMSGLN
jgi:hypothetical protein